MKNGTIALSEVNKLDIRVGTIIEVRSNPELTAEKFQVFVNFGGDLGILRTSTDNSANDKREQLIGKQVMAVVNIEPSNTQNNDSECLILGASEKESKPPILIQPEQSIKNGLKVC